MSNALRKRLPRLILWAAVLFAFVMATLPHPVEVPGRPSDKIQHIVAFATLGFLTAWAYPKTRWARSLLYLVLFGALIEIVQTIPSLNRDGDVVDLIADVVASATALALCRWRSFGSRSE